MLIECCTPAPPAGQIDGLCVLSLVGGGVLGLVVKIFLAHRINTRLACGRSRIPDERGRVIRF